MSMYSVAWKKGDLEHHRKERKLHLFRHKASEMGLVLEVTNSPDLSGFKLTVEGDLPQDLRNYIEELGGQLSDSIIVI